MFTRMGKHEFKISKLPVRQYTKRNSDRVYPNVSKLPVRQYTVLDEIPALSPISKLPVRQYTFDVVAL